ncbi:expressed unknown protein [Seminavis robusta]|uniref:Uncharacterized protein n=1 Tax=Seminavis robusta TaxID=568900 RepID=A0A9N8DWG3_9STRA|nr:expressed unknown protein [Seminavis robusta]|eukprot:Sro415_g138500.1 n/a (824) ;mRNA; f:24281-26752
MTDVSSTNENNGSNNTFQASRTNLRGMHRLVTIHEGRKPDSRAKYQYYSTDDMRRIILILLHLSGLALSLALSSTTVLQTATVARPASIIETGTSNPYASQVLRWLDSEGISWKFAHDKIPVLWTNHCKTSTFVELEKSSILLHLIPTPKSLDESLPPTLNRKLTEWTTLTSSSSFRKVIHLHEDIWIHKHDICKARLLVQSLAKAPKRIFARKTTARRFNATNARAFLTANHLWGATKARYYYGLFLKEELVAVATFSKCRKVQRMCNYTTINNITNQQQDDNQQQLQLYNETFHSYELIRYCSQKDSTVVGGISKLLKQFVRDRQADHNNNNNIPMDIVTMVDRDWGAATGWEASLPFQTMSILDPLVMAVNPNEPGQRRYLVGAGLQHDNDNQDEEVQRRQRQSGLRPRLGLSKDTLMDLNNLSNPTQAYQRLAKDHLYPVFDAGVERLYMLVPPQQQQQQAAFLDAKVLWQTAKPKYTTRYYSSNSGIVSLLQHAAIGSPPLDAPFHATAMKSWRETTADSSELIFSQMSSMDPEATIEVCQREQGWRTMRFVKPKSKSTRSKVSSIYHSIYKVNPNTGRVEPEIVIQEHLKTMAVLSLMAESDDAQDKKDLRFLHFGYGAGTLVRLLAHHASNSQHVAVELDQAVVDAATVTRMHHDDELPNVSIIAQDAIQYVQAGTTIPPHERFDSICIDVFDENNFVPETLYATSFLQRLRKEVLASAGLLVWNFHSGGKRRTRVMADAFQAVSAVFGETHCCWVPSLDSTPTGGNAILVACKKAPLPVDGDGNISLTRNALAAQTKYNLSFDAVARVQFATSTE